MYSESFETNTIDGAIWITIPHFPYRLMSLTMKHYHVGDVNLFWEDIRLNSLARIKSYFRPLHNLRSKGSILRNIALGRKSFLSLNSFLVKSPYDFLASKRYA